MQAGSNSQDSQSNDHIYNRGRQKGISQWITCHSIKQENGTPHSFTSVIDRDESEAAVGTALSETGQLKI